MLGYRIPEIALGALLTILVFAMGFVAASQFLPQTPSIQTKQEPSKGIGQQANPNAPVAGHEGEHAESANNNTPQHAPEVTFLGVRIGEGLLALATFLLVLATWLLVNDAKDNARRQLRAYISITPKDVLNWTNAPHFVGIRFDIKNHGETPGFGIFYEFSILILDDPLPTDFIWPATDMNYDQSTTLFPDENVPVRIFLERHLTTQEITEIESGAKRFHTRGVMRYRDAFEGNRTTKFSFSFGGVDFADSMKGVPGASWNWNHGQTHNDST